MVDRTDDGTGTRFLATVSAIALCVGLLVGLVLLATFGEVIVAFLLAGVLPTVLGYAGLSKAGALPWKTDGTAVDEDADLVEELKRQYAAGQLDDEELERKIEAVMAAEEGGRQSRSREREYDTLRR